MDQLHYARRYDLDKAKEKESIKDNNSRFVHFRYERQTETMPFNSTSFVAGRRKTEESESISIPKYVITWLGPSSSPKQQEHQPPWKELEHVHLILSLAMGKSTKNEVIKIIADCSWYPISLSDFSRRIFFVYLK